jgi:hypothetical protein
MMNEEDEAFHWVETESKLRKQLIHELTHKTDPVEDFRNRLADAIEAMPFGDTAQSFAAFVRQFK